MSFRPEEEEPKVCAKTGKVIERSKRYAWLRWLFPLSGLAALVWFLIRVIPKPSRATYPCQRVAFPLASGFVVWLIGALGSIAAFRKAQRYLIKNRYVLAGVCAIISIGVIWLAVSIEGGKEAIGVARTPQPVNSPIGEAKGVLPGRVVWVHEPNAVEWGGGGSGKHWFDDDCLMQPVINKMLSRAIRSVSGETTDGNAWDAIFRYFNNEKGRGDVGYTPGEKIAIKINMTLTYTNDPNMDKVTPGDWDGNDFIDMIDNSPQLAIALINQLTDVVGVDPCDITIGDPARILPNYWYDKVEPNCPGVVYYARVGGKGRTQSTLVGGAPFYWSDPDASHFEDVIEPDYVPLAFTQADYVINMPILKDHPMGGITLCGKNLYGALQRNPIVWDDPPHMNDWYSMHLSLCDVVPGMGHYRALVDLMGHSELGGKTLLYIIDGLYFADSSAWADARRWYMAPFNGDWTSSIFVSQDGVAVDSVGFDFINAERPYDPGANMSGVDDYLHQAADANSWPADVNYDPEHDGIPLKSIGVHEHWNNPNEKLYSRNIDPVSGTGIELLLSNPADIDGSGSVDYVELQTICSQWLQTAVANEPPLSGDVYPQSSGDGIVNFHDFAFIALNWTVAAAPQPPGQASNPSPANGATGVSTTTDLSWTVGSGATSHDVYFGTASTPPFIQNQAGTTYDTGTMANSTTYYWRINEKNAVGTTTGIVWSFATTAAGGLPSPWVSQDIGNPGAAGSASYSSGTFTVNGDGADISGTSDSFQFVYQPASGDCEIIARVVSLTNVVADWAKAGIMIRGTLDANSTFALGNYTTNVARTVNSWTLLHRDTTGGTATQTVWGSAVPPYWLRVVRTGNSFSGYVSSAGSSWTLITTATINMATDVYVGLAVTSHQAGALSTAVFDNVTVVP